MKHPVEQVINDDCTYLIHTAAHSKNKKNTFIVDHSQESKKYAMIGMENLLWGS